MDRERLKSIWRETLAVPNEPGFEEVARSIAELYRADKRFREHIKNRSKRVKETTGVEFDPDNFDLDSARAFVADELGFAGWNELLHAVAQPDKKPILFHYAVAAMDRGDFTALQETIGEERFHDQIVEWVDKGYFIDEQQTLDEIFAAACMLGYPETASLLLDKGVDPYAGMKTGLAGFHYAASSGRLEVINLLIERGIPMEVKNMYGGTVFGQAIWSAAHEHTPQHAAIVEALIEAGAEVDEGYPEWWDEQEVPDPKTKELIASALARRGEFHKRLSDAKKEVSNAESQSDKRAIADALKALGNILRRPPFLREQANAVYERAAKIYKELGLPLEEAWVKRHTGINHEYAERLEEAEKFYDEALSLYREHSAGDLNYANAVRYPAVIKNRLGKREESRELWEEACHRYENIHEHGLGEGVAEASAWLTIFAIEKGDLTLADQWFAKANEASSRSNDPDTHKFINEVRERLESAKQTGV
jgi:ankyrin repeat protein